MNWQEIFEKYNLEYSELNQFKQKAGIELLKDEDFKTEIKWLKNYNLMYEILPVFTNNESDMVGIFTSGILKGKIACVSHDDISFAPRFRNLKSFIAQINSNEIEFDWQDLSNDCFDYPSIKTISAEEQKNDNEILAECWRILEQTNDEDYKFLAETIINLTPYADIERIVPFLHDRDFQEIQGKAAWVLGAIHKYLPVKERIREVTKGYGKHYLNKFYDGNLFDKKQSLWQKLFKK